MLVIGANLVVDRILTLDRLVPGRVMRPQRAEAGAGGKAVNVCRAAQAHGVRPPLVANLPGRFGAVVADLLRAEGHDVHPVPTAGEIRSAIIIREPGGRTTVLNEPGPSLSAADRTAFLDAVTAACPGHRLAVASGSLPPGATGLYADLVARVHEAGLRIVLDAARADLADALPAGPDVVTPNLAEALEVVTGTAQAETVEPDAPDPRAAALDAAQQLRGLGAGAAVVTAGRHGVALADADGRLWVEAPTVAEVNPIGAGDAFAAGLGLALERGEDLRSAVRLGVASATASVTTELAGQVDPEALAELLDSLGWEAPR